MAETARPHAVSGSFANGGTVARAAVANHQPGRLLIAQQREADKVVE